MPVDREQQARTAWGALQAHGYSPTRLTGILGATPDLATPTGQHAVLALADRLAGRPGPDRDAADTARAAGFHPPAAYDGAWQLDVTAVPDSPEGAAVTLAGHRWEIVRRMAEGWPTSSCLAGHDGVWCERTLQRFRDQNMTTAPSRYDAYQYAADEVWLERCDDAEHDLVGSALRWGVLQVADLHEQHPHRLLLVRQQAEARKAKAREKARERRAAGRAGAQLAFAL